MVGLTLTTALLLTGCSNGADAHPNLTYNQVVTQSTKNVKEAVAHLGPPGKPKLVEHDWDPGGPIACSDGAADDTTPVAYNKTWGVKNLKEPVADSQQRFIHYWEKKGWTLRSGRIIDGQAIMLSPDGYALNYETGSTRAPAFIGVDTPCVTRPKATTSRHSS